MFPKEVVESLSVKCVSVTTGLPPNKKDGSECIGNSLRQTTRCGPPAWELGEGLTFGHHKNSCVAKYYIELRPRDRTFGIK